MSLADKPCDAPLKVWGEAVQGDKGGGTAQTVRKVWTTDVPARTNGRLSRVACGK